eukprot:TRINITY_DN63560_c0_g1_i1.p1 TRINITY_DN63560_c0_g1~~TRINITY_DN63560_c0_g1_i1.p1  ORF type:complete len:414 (-),score=57.87 TRINITY_DN63560_c0_g1_i1:5-1195(-)
MSNVKFKYKNSSLGEILNSRENRAGEEPVHVVDIDKMIKSIVKIRLPRLKHNGRCEPLPRIHASELEETLELTTCSKRLRGRLQKKRAQVVDFLNSTVVALRGVKTTLGSYSALRSCVKKCVAAFGGSFRPFITKYAADIFTNVGYLIGPSILGIGMYAASQATIRSIQTKFIVLAGIASQIFMLWKNFHIIMGTFFAIVDDIFRIVDQAIETLQSEIVEAVKEREVNTAIAHIISWKLNYGIEIGKQKLSVHCQLPCVIRNRCYFVISFFIPLLACLLCSQYGVVMAELYPESTTSARRPHVTTTFSPVNGQLGFPFFDKTLSTEVEHQYETVAVNVLIAVLASTPMIMLYLNFTVWRIEVGINAFLQKEAVEAIPGGELHLQEQLDEISACAIS